MLRLRPARPDLCQHDSGLLRLYHLLWNLVSSLLAASAVFTANSGRRTCPRHRCRSRVLVLPPLDSAAAAAAPLAR